jgi:gamma-glutamylcyclotransferase (GGCT)/AIG2-like uncharacterized protein YtfP
MHYFAYGSNMHLRRLMERVGDCIVHSAAKLHGFSLEFHKRAGDGSGKCNAFHTGKAADVMHGVVFEIDRAQRKILDRFEGLGFGYHIQDLQVESPLGTIDAYAYIASNDHIDHGARPYSWYKAFVVEGARQHGLPQSYINRISAIEAVSDPDPDRERANRLILAPA